jgi:BCD family chlorophyll transporter-like MFS transporter
MLRKQIQLGFIHVAVAMTLVPINSTLNRVMIKELSISATLVAIMASLPYLLSPVQVAIGSYSDRHPILRLYRTPYILIGLLLCVAGVVIAPQIAFFIAENFWLGLLIGILAFGAWGMGYNLAAVSYLSLASELSGEQRRGRTIAVMWFMMITGIILTAVILSRLVEPYSPATLQHAFWIVGAAALVLGLLGLINLESRSNENNSGEVRYSWNAMIQTIWDNPHARLFFWYLIILLAALLGQDILLEPFAAEAFQMSVRETTRITSIWGIFVLVAILLTGWLETRLRKRSLAIWGGWIAHLGFVMIVFSGVFLNKAIFFTGVVLLGVGTGISTVSNLALMLDMTVAGQVGLFIGAWGMANAISRLVGSVLGGIGRDIITQISGNPVLGYVVVFGVMAGFMLISLAMLARIDVSAFRKTENQVSVVERAAISGDA